MQKSNEYIKLIDVNTKEAYICKPNEEFIAIKGIFRLWGDARIMNDDNETICHLRVLDFKDGKRLPACLFPPKKKATKADDD